MSQYDHRPGNYEPQADPNQQIPPHQAYGQPPYYNDPYGGQWDPQYEDYPQSTPAIVWLFMAYCIFVALFGVIGLLIGFAGVFAPEFMMESNPDLTMEEARLGGFVWLFIGFLMTIPYVIGAFLPSNTVTWVVKLILIIGSIFFGCCLPLAIPLLIFWVLEPNRRYHGM